MDTVLILGVVAIQLVEMRLAVGKIGKRTNAIIENCEHKDRLKASLYRKVAVIAMLGCLLTAGCTEAQARKAQHVTESVVSAGSNSLGGPAGGAAGGAVATLLGLWIYRLCRPKKDEE